MEAKKPNFRHLALANRAHQTTLSYFSDSLTRVVLGSLVRRYPDRGLGDGRAARISTRPAISTIWWMPSHLARNTIQGNPICEGGRGECLKTARSRRGSQYRICNGPGRST